ncbi:Acetyl-CoA:oxalate CoA-transferase [Rhodoplanes serenus]|uniref:Acetyl-CoA:oxalate CoA-transferase n=1 Tax=Rhodoplanes serenus TaxID=200615 RepID=A0A3S4B7A1_9BRAD|nr:CoA transferase [Rhodoplanes serenus]VCU10867.1 Acetyl-CoA:oxalate CoA-transferase [Rhodoplanes serenus]
MVDAATERSPTEEQADGTPTPEAGDLPLAGMRVLDLSRALSGPFCAMILADLGADVVKVEPAPAGDMIRAWGPFDHGESVYYLSTNRNKRSLVVDFRSPDGLRLLRDLALASDVVVENFKPGTMAAMGLDPAGLRAERPGLIVASISGFGSRGPLGAQPGFDQIAQGYAGFMSFTGTAESGPTRVGVAIGDLAAGLWAAIGVLAAWITRQRSGRGQGVEASLFAGLIGLLSMQGQRWLSLGDVAGPAGNHHPIIAPYGVFRAADGDLNIAAATQDMWVSLCGVLGVPALADDPRFRDNAGRMHHRDALHAAIDERLAARTRAEWTARLVAAGIPAGPINDVADALSEPQVTETGLVETVQHPTIGALRQVVTPIGLSDLEGRCVRRPPPRLGEHSAEVLAEFGYAPDAIAALMDGRVVFGGEAARP